MTKTASHMIWRQWMIGFLFCGLFIAHAAITEYRLSQITVPVGELREIDK